MNKFDSEVNNILAKKIEKAKKKVRKQIAKVSPPNTPGNRPVHQGSPALSKGITQDMSDTPMPMGAG